MKKLMLLAALLLVGCDEENMTDKASKSSSLYGMNYGKDTRTGLCFVFFDRGIANVPCSPEVEKLIPAPTTKNSCK